MKKFTLLFLAFFGVGLLGNAQIISQYIETNSGTEPKGIEIWNNTDSQLDFNANTLLIEKGTNGAPLSGVYTLESGTLDAGDVLVIGTSDLQATTEGNGADFYEHAFTFNGNDALAVSYGGTTTDVFGMPEEDPGSAWEGNGVSTKDQNIGLLTGITSGDTDGWTDPSERFETVNTDPSGANGDEGFGIAPEGGDNQTPSITNIQQTPEVVTSSDEVNVSADVTDSDGTVENVELHWGTTSGSLTNTINMSTTRAAYTTDSPIPAQDDGTTVYYEVFAEDNVGGTSTSSELNYTVTDPATTGLPYEQTFDADLGDTYTYSVSGDNEEWYWYDDGGNGVAAMNGYNTGDTEIDWLILPGINFDEYESEFMTFETWYQYGTDDENNYLKLYYSTDYEGVGDPSEATWTELDYNQPGSEQTWASSGEVDLSGISGTQVYIGYKYKYEPGMYRLWQVDNISIQEQGGNNTPEITNITQTPEVVTSSDEVNVSADVTDSDGTVENVELHWGTTSGSLTNTINMSTTRAAYTTDSPIPAQDDGTTVYYEVFAEDNEGGTSTSTELTYTVTDPATTGLPYEQTFDADLGDTYTYSVSGDNEEWYWYDDGGNGVAAMNGYDTGDTEIDWLILPGINFDEYESEFMTFETWYNYGEDDENNYLKLYYSTDYEGVGDPSEATWTELDYNQPESAETWASSGEVDLSGISGTQVYIGYKYRYEPGMYRLWQVDNISIQEEGGNETPEISNVTHTPEVITSSDEVNVSADVTDSDGTVENVELHWGTESGSLNNTINMSTTRATYTTDSPIPAQDDGTTVYYEVFAEDNEGGTSTSSEMSYTVTDPATTGLPYEQTFDATLGDTYTYSVSGDTKEWYWSEYDGNGYAAMNGYDSGDTEIDWLILPGINFDEYENEFMAFDTWYNYGEDDENNYLKLYYSTDYEGVGDPSEATWTELDYNQPENAQTWASSGEVDLSGISGTQVYIGYKYRYEPGMYRQWEVDNITVDQSTGIDPVADNGDRINVYPNPAHSTFTLKTDAVNGSQIHIYSVTGRIVYRKILRSNETQINASNLEPGIYIVRVIESQGQKAKSEKIIIR